MKSWQKNGARIIAVNFSLPQEALEILQRRSPSRRSYGNFVARLLFEHEVREEERQRIREELDRVLSDVGAPA
jgi:hypothetical protein